MKTLSLPATDGTKSLSCYNASMFSPQAVGDENTQRLTVLNFGKIFIVTSLLRLSRR